MLSTLCAWEAEATETIYAPKDLLFYGERHILLGWLELKTDCAASEAVKVINHT